MTTSPISPSSNVSRGLFSAVAVTLASLAPAAVLFFAQPASAQTAAVQSAPAAQIRIDLQAKTPEAVQNDIKAAVRSVCEATSLHSPLFPRDITDCRRQAEAQALAQLKAAQTELASRD